MLKKLIIPSKHPIKLTGEVIYYGPTGSGPIDGIPETIVDPKKPITTTIKFNTVKTTK